MRHLFIVCLYTIVLVGSSSCVAPTLPYLLPPPPSEEVRAKLGTIGVVSARFVPEAKIETPAKGWLSGAGKGAGQGATMGAVIGGTLALGGGYGALLALGTIPGGALVGSISGSIYGAATALPTATEEQAESTLKAALSDLKIQEAMRDQVIKTGQDQTHHRFILLGDQGPTVFGEVDYRPLTENGMDTILEISVPTVRLETDLGANPPIALFMTVRARLIRTVDNELLYVGTVEYRSGKHLFTEWAADHAQLFREELGHSSQSLAEKIVEELFLLYRS